VKARIAIIAALPREIVGLVRGTKPDSELLRRGVHLHLLGDAVIVAAGMGAGRVTLAVQAAVAAGSVECLISVGLAGSCMPGLRPGAVVEADRVIDARTGERFLTVGVGENFLLVTSDSIASVKEKARLGESYGAAMVDMEAATVARLAGAHGVAFRAIKAISDAHDFELASLSRFATAQGHFRTGAFALHTALRPHTWPKTVRLGRDSNRALTGLNERLRGILAADRDA
jgi:adenosylhomocysteine nucleosidase